MTTLFTFETIVGYSTFKMLSLLLHLGLPPCRQTAVCRLSVEVGCSQGQAVGCSQVVSSAGCGSSAREGGGAWRGEADPAEDVDPLSSLARWELQGGGRLASAAVHRSRPRCRPQ